jgi:hypothetical protein
LRRPAAAALLGLVLVLAQTWLAAHGLEHLFHQADEPCQTCTIGAGIGGPLARAGNAPLPPPHHGADRASPASGIAPRPHGHRPQAARAPPAAPPHRPVETAPAGVASAGADPAASMQPGLALRQDLRALAGLPLPA